MDNILDKKNGSKLEKICREGDSYLKKMREGKEGDTVIDRALMENVYLKDYLDVTPLNASEKALCNFILMQRAKDLN